MMKLKLILFLILFPVLCFSQQSREKNVDKKVMGYLAEAETHYAEGDLAMAEAAYRKAIAIAPDNDLAQYNFGNLYINYKKENEALLNLGKASKESKKESIRHKSFHNQGNILMEREKYAQAVKVYKEALKNDPTDDETRYNYALAKELMEKQKQNQQDKNKNKNKDKKKDKKEEDKNKKGGEGENEEEKKDKGKSKDESKKKEGEDGKPKEDKNQDKQAKQDEQKQSGEQEKKKARKAELSEQQVKNILKAIENSEKKVQKKLNKDKRRGKPVRTEKDW